MPLRRLLPWPPAHVGVSSMLIASDRICCQPSPSMEQRKPKKPPSGSKRASIMRRPSNQAAEKVAAVATCTGRFISSKCHDWKIVQKRVNNTIKMHAREDVPKLV